MKFKDSISKCSECSKEIEMTDMAEKILCSCGNHYFNPNYSKERANKGPDQIIMNKPLPSAQEKNYDKRK